MCVGGCLGDSGPASGCELREDRALTPHTEPGQGSIMVALTAVGTLVAK